MNDKSKYWLIEAAIREHWGERCPEYDDHCYICRAWEIYDELCDNEKEEE